MSDRPRIEPLPQDQWDDLLRGVLDAAPGGQERPVNVFTTLARHPKLFRDWIRLGGRLLAGSSFTPRERELAIPAHGPQLLERVRVGPARAHRARVRPRRRRDRGLAR